MLNILRKPPTSIPKSNKTPAQIRVQKDITELDMLSTMKANWPSKENLLNFTLEIRPDDGFYQGGVYKFSFEIPAEYPYAPPKVKCLQKIYHPNIDLEGNICLNILREDWKPVLNLNSVFVGLQYLFLEPNMHDFLNREAADALRDDESQFRSDVKKSMAGHCIRGEQYDDVQDPVPDHGAA